MRRAEQPDVPLQERQVHQHRGLLQVPVSARLRSLRQAKLLHPLEQRLEFRQGQRPGVGGHRPSLSPYTLHCVKEKRNVLYLRHCT